MNETPLSGNNFLQMNTISEAEREFINFISEFRRSYGTKEEYNFRLSVFEEKFNHIKQHNSEGHSFNLGINHMADWTEYEYKQLLGYKPELRTEARQEVFPKINSKAASSIDWRDYGAVTGVKNQGSCGSCWSFSTTGSLEGANQIATGTLISLSEQELVDCDRGLTANHGCNGGIMDTAFKWIKSNGLTTEDAYPYTGKGNESCQSFNAVVFDTGFTDVESCNPDAMIAALQVGPVSIAIEADQMSFQLYKDGVLAQSKCGDQLDHGVLAVGYGHDSSSGKDYWLVKNSWGVTWGEQGYIKLERTSNSDCGTCGLLTEPSYPSV